MTKRFLPLAAFAIVLASCNSTPKQAVQPPVVDAATTQPAPQQELVTHELPQNASYQTAPSTTTTKTENNTTHVVNNSSTSHTATSSNSAGTTTKKKGWSKTAKGAVIGGVAGAIGGAVIDKKNPLAGAAIGAAVGAGTGAVIGNGMDKKDGRH